MRIAVLLLCVGLALAEKSTSKRGIGAEAFAKPQSQDSGSSFNLQGILSANQLAPQPIAVPSDQFLTGYQSDYLGQHGGFGFSGFSGFGGGYSQIPPQVAPQQKPAQLALAAAAAIAQQNFGHPAYGAPPPRQDPAALQNNQLYAQLPQYREYERQIQDYVRQPIALNYGNTQINAFPPPRRQQLPAPQPTISTFQPYGQGQRASLGSYYGSSYDQDLFQAAPAQVRPEVPQPTAIPYAAPQPVSVQYSAEPSYGLQSAKGPGGSYSYSSFASGGHLVTPSGFRPINP